MSSWNFSQKPAGNVSFKLLQRSSNSANSLQQGLEQQVAPKLAGPSLVALCEAGGGLGALEAPGHGASHPCGAGGAGLVPGSM